MRSFTLWEVILTCVITEKQIKATKIRCKYEERKIEGTSELEFLVKKTFCFHVNKVIYFSASFYFLALPREERCWDVQFAADRTLYKGTEVKIITLLAQKKN